MARAAIDAVAGDVAALAHRYALPEVGERQLLALLELVATDPLAPTTVHEPPAIVADHLADSLVALELPVVRAASRIADIGSGAGFPGLPLAIALVGSSVQLLDSSSRKCAFIERAIQTCSVPNARAVQARAEAWEEGLGAFDLVTARALAALDVVAEYAAPLLCLGGSLVAWRGRRDPADEAAAARAAEELGLELAASLPVRPVSVGGAPPPPAHVEGERNSLPLSPQTRSRPQATARQPLTIAAKAAPASDRVRR